MENILKANLDVLKYVSKMISDETGCNIIICDHEGEIIEATVEERIGRKHMGAVLILSGETDEAVISKEQEEEYRRLGTDTRRGYNYVINILGKRVGSLGVAGEPEVLKPIVRIAAKTIGFYISEYLREKEKNKILQKMARIAEEIAEQPYEEIDFQVFADDLLLITGAQFVLFDLNNSDGQTATVAGVAGKPGNTGKLRDFLGFSILGCQREITKHHRHSPKGNKALTRFYKRFSDYPCSYIPVEKRNNLASNLMIGEVCSLEIGHKGKKVGSFCVLMPKGEKLHNVLLAELYAAQVGQLLRKVQAESALKKSETELKEALSILDSFWEHSPNPISIIDKSGNIIRVSKSASDILGCSPEDLQGHTMSGVLPPMFAGFLRRRLRRVDASKEPASYSDSLSLPDGTTRHYDSCLFPIDNGREELTMIGLAALDVTDRNKNEEQFKYLSLHDSLTGLYNRTFFDKEINRLNKNNNYPLTIMVLDTDGLKLINDSMGHDRGDLLLKRLAGILKSSVRESDILARIGGDEFVIMLPKAGQTEAQIIAARIKDSISRYNCEYPNLPLSVSIGQWTTEEPGEDLAEVFKKADELMYQNKTAKMENSRSQIVKSMIEALGWRDSKSIPRDPRGNA